MEYISQKVAICSLWTVCPCSYNRQDFSSFLVSELTSLITHNFDYYRTSRFSTHIQYFIMVCTESVCCWLLLGEIAILSAGRLQFLECRVASSVS